MLRFFLCFLVLVFFFDPHALLFILFFQGLRCHPAFEIDLLYVILCHVLSYLLHFLYQHTQSLSASLWSHELTGQSVFPVELFIDDCQVFAWRSVVWSGLAISHNGHLPHLWHFIILLCQLEGSGLVGAYIEKQS